MARQHTRRRSSRRERQARACALCLALAMALMLGRVAAQRFAAHGNVSRSTNAATTLTPIRYQAQTTSAEQPTPSAAVMVDAQEAQAADLPALADALRGAALPEDVLPFLSDTSEAAAKLRPDWFTWAHLDAKRARIHVIAPAIVGTDGLGAYAVRGEWGMSLCLVNKTHARLLTTAQLRLPRGVYTIERLTVGKGSGEEEKTERNAERGVLNDELNSHSSLIPHPSSLSAPSTCLSHLQGCDLGGTGTVRKVFCLEPGQMCVYRCVDSAREARGAWYEVFTQLREMGAHQSGPARRLSGMLREANSYVAGVQGGGGKHGRDARLECIHHLLLITAQAHSLHHNYQMRHTVDERAGRDVMATLDRLTASLSDTSAALLGLVPQVSVQPAAEAKTSAVKTTDVNAEAKQEEQARIALLREQPHASTANKISPAKKITVKQENNPGASNIQTRADRIVVVSLENTGGRSVHNVKLGLNMAGMPGSATCAPADPAYFDALRPGQSVRATFHVRSAAGADLPNMLFTGDVSYFAGTAPAHLRPRAW